MAGDRKLLNIKNKINVVTVYYSKFNLVYKAYFVLFLEVRKRYFVQSPLHRGCYRFHP